MHEQIPLALGHRVALGVEDFLVAPSNRRAVDWIDRWPDWPSTALVLAGPVGSGKTHLGQLWRARSRAEVVDLAQSGVEQAVMVAEGARAALLDDAERAAGDTAAELALLQLYNLLQANGGHLLMASTKAPSAWNVRLPDLASRLSTAVVATIEAPDDALLASVALKLFADRQLTVGEGVISLLLTREERSFAALAQAIEALDRAALAGKRAITVALAREVLAV